MIRTTSPSPIGEDGARPLSRLTPISAPPSGIGYLVRFPTVRNCPW
jgi:hypothetical protein